MPKTISHGSYTIPFDEEIFAMYLENEPDLVTNAFLSSGAMVEDGYIASLIANGSNLYTIPFYGALADEDDENYDGKTDITLDTMGAAYQTGVVYGRAHGWYADDFVADFTVANPLAAIAARVAKYWQNKRYARTIGIVDAVLGVSAMSSHVITKNELTPTLLSDVTQEIWGDHKGDVSLAIMHSAVAQSFEDMERVEYLKYTDPNGVTRSLNIFTVNGLTTIIDDGVPKTATSATAGVYTLTIGGTPASGDTVTVEGTTVTLDATSAASTNAAASAIKTALGSVTSITNVYTIGGSGAKVTFTEKSGYYGNGAPAVSKTGTVTASIATTTAPIATSGYAYSTYLFRSGALHHASAPVAHPVFWGRDELKRGGMEYFGNRFRETIHPNGFSYTLPQVDNVDVISPTDTQLGTTAQWALAYSNHKMIPFAKVITPGHSA